MSEQLPSTIRPDHEREWLYRLMRLVGLVCLPFACGVAVVFGIVFGLLPGLIVGLLAISIALYPIFGFRRVNEWLQQSRHTP